MKRDDDYIRTLLFEAEAADVPYVLAPMTLSDDGDDLKRHVHARWLSDAGLFEEVNKAGVFRITNQGQDYLAAIRDEGVWSKSKEVAAGVGGVTMDIMRDIAVGVVKQQIAKLGLPM